MFGGPRFVAAQIKWGTDDAMPSRRRFVKFASTPFLLSVSALKQIRFITGDLVCAGEKTPHLARELKNNYRKANGKIR